MNGATGLVHYRGTCPPGCDPPVLFCGSDAGHSAPIANNVALFIVNGSMKWRVRMIIGLALAMAPLALAGTDRGENSTGPSDEPSRFDFALETAYLFGAINPPANYQISANFLTARVRWGDYLDRRGFFRGYNQVYLSLLAEPYFSGGLGLGWIDSQPERFGGQGQDFTFNILTAAGLSYQFSDRFSGQLGVLYQHLSNAGQTDPNPSLNLFGPQVGFTYSF